MPRNITAAAKTASQSGHVILIGLALLDFASAPVYVASTPYNVDYDIDGDLADETFLGAGRFGRVSGPEEGAEQRAYQVAYKLSGIDPALVSDALNEDYRGRDSKLWLALCDEDYQVIDDPVLVHWGLMDTMPIKITADGKAEIVVKSIDRRARWEEAPHHRWNNAAHQALHPGDLAFEQMEANVETELVWPKAA